MLVSRAALATYALGGVGIGMHFAHLFGLGPDGTSLVGFFLVVASVVGTVLLERLTFRRRGERVERLSRDLIERRLVGEFVTCVTIGAYSTRRQPFTTDLAQVPGSGALAELAAQPQHGPPRSVWVLTHRSLLPGAEPRVVLVHPDAPDVGVLYPSATPQPGLEDGWWRVLQHARRDWLLGAGSTALGAGVGVLIAFAT